jgi:hypothetical protein
MANEIYVNTNFKADKSNLSVQHQRTINATLSGTVYAAGAPSIPTTSTGTALAMGSVTTAGWSYMVNTDATNYVEVGIQQGGVFYAFVKLKPGEYWVGRLGTNAPYARANTAAVVLQYTILQD